MYYNKLFINYFRIITFRTWFVMIVLIEISLLFNWFSQNWNHLRASELKKFILVGRTSRGQSFRYVKSIQFLNFKLEQSYMIHACCKIMLILEICICNVNQYKFLIRLIDWLIDIYKKKNINLNLFDLVWIYCYLKLIFKIFDI